MGDALSTVEGIYTSLQASLDDMLMACPTQADRDTVMSKYVAARENYWNCIKKAFHDDDPALQALVAEGKTDIDAIKNINDSLGDITKVIDTITHAVTVGSQFAAKLIAL
jgi:hypothetical protein